MIRPALVTWRKATKGLLMVAEKVDEESRDKAIESIESLLDVREKLQPEIVAPFTPEEEAFGKELVALEVEVQKKLVFLNEQIYTGISETQSKKNHMKSYVNPYASMMQDGAYYDTKK